MGIPVHATVAEVLTSHRRRRHRVEILNRIEDEICRLTRERKEQDDEVLWRCGEDKFRKKINSKGTWNQFRIPSPTHNLYIGVWFTHSTPKYLVFAWLAALDRLSTGNRTKIWMGQSHCVLCENAEESRNHLFFTCRFSSVVWKELTWNLLGNNYTTAWEELTSLIQIGNFNHISMFIIRYTFQATIYHLWRERNCRRHGEQPLSPIRLTKTIDKAIQNRLSLLKTMGDQKYSEGLMEWFRIRSP